MMFLPDPRGNRQHWWSRRCWTEWRVTCKDFLMLKSVRV